MDDARVVFVSLPREEASKLAKEMCERRLCACVNIIPKIESFYWWEGEVNQDQEALLVIKTSSERMVDLMEYVCDVHPYDLPEIIALPIADGLPDYLNWVKRESTAR
ncbi:MAG: divalent-cation tolerance protein CutA [candidate division Zixibacteria bacterium]